MIAVTKGEGALKGNGRRASRTFACVASALVASCGARTGILADDERAPPVDAAGHDADSAGADGADAGDDVVPPRDADTSTLDGADAACPIDDDGGKAPPVVGTNASSVDFSRWYAVSSFDLGVTGADAWTKHGFDLDHRITTACQSLRGDHTCRRAPGAPDDALVDGPLGVDDNFARYVTSAIAAARPDVQKLSDDAIIEGHPTLLLRLDDLGNLDEDDRVPGALYLTGAMREPPTFTIADAWTVDSTSVVGDDIRAPVISFPAGYVSGGVWVSGAPAAFVLHAPWMDTVVTLPLVAGRITMQTHEPFAGQLVGAVAASDARPGIEPALARLGICPGSAAYDAVQTAIEHAPDLVRASSDLQADGVTCDAISIGLGFNAGLTGAPEFVFPPRPSKTLCGP